MRQIQRTKLKIIVLNLAELLVSLKKDYNLGLTGERVMRIGEKCIIKNKSKVTKGQTDSSNRLKDIKRPDKGAGRW